MNKSIKLFSKLKKFSFKFDVNEDRKDSGVILSPPRPFQSDNKHENEQSSISTRSSSFFSSLSSIKSKTFKTKLEPVDPDRSPYFIQTWWDPPMVGDNSKCKTASPRTKPLHLVPYLPPIWVDEEIEEILVNDEEVNIPIIITMPDDDEQDISQNQSIPLQDSNFLTVPTETTILIRTSKPPKKSKNHSCKVRFQLGARIDPYEDCLLNFQHSVHTKRHHCHKEGCQHVRFTLEGNEREVIENTEPKTPKHKINHELTSCLKQTQERKQLKSILRKNKQSSSRHKQVSFDQHLTKHIVDRHIEWNKNVYYSRTIRRIDREIRLEKRRQFILTKPIEKWIDVIEQDEGLPRDGEDNEEEYNDDNNHSQNLQFTKFLVPLSQHEQRFIKQRNSHSLMEQFNFIMTSLNKHCNHGL